MSSGMDSSILDTYLYEENNLLDQLDEMLVADEKNGDFSTDDVNEIFRIMHTIKGSSAMMEFNSISTIAHHIEDVFFYIRDKGIETLDPEHKKELFNLMFRSEDYLRSEIEKVEQGVPLSTDIDAFSNEINSFLKKISGAAPAQPEASQAAPAASGAAASAPAAPASLPDDKDAACFFHVFLEALCSHDLIQRVVERPQIRVNFTLQVARQETEFFTRLNRRTRQDNTAYLIVSECRDRHRHRKVRFSGSGRADAEDDHLFPDRIHVRFLTECFRFDRTACDRVADAVTVDFSKAASAVLHNK